MLFIRCILYFLFSLFIGNTGFADQFKNVDYDICFTPGDNCTNLIVENIKMAKRTLLIQAYSFTSTPIAKAVVDAKKRGVDVKIILDKSQFSAKYSSSQFFLNQKIPIWNDSKLAIAHNKVIIIDSNIVITGSFNFTKAAQEKNAENLLVIRDPKLSEKFENNWKMRMVHSQKIN